MTSFWTEGDSELSENVKAANECGFKSDPQSIARDALYSKAHKLFEGLGSQIDGKPSEAFWREAACYASSLVDLCLWADRATRGRCTYIEAKARFEKIEREASAPVLTKEQVDELLDAIGGGELMR